MLSYLVYLIDMPRSVLVTLTDPIPDAVVGQPATVTVGTNVYNGEVTGIVVHQAVPDSTTITIEGQGLKVKTLTA